jgi:hypothetical protein
VLAPSAARGRQAQGAPGLQDADGEAASYLLNLGGDEGNLY